MKRKRTAPRRSNRLRRLPRHGLFTRLQRKHDIIAAVDLGSNSFHMLVARSQDGTLHVLDKLQEMVRLAGGLDARNRLSAAARKRAFDCLARFGQRLRGLPRGSVRAVGTNTLRRMHDADGFLAAAERALGHPIEIIAGREEARLIYQGMAQSRPNDGKRRLVVDIGGGSTELIIGEGHEPLSLESLHMGCVSYSQAHFGAGAITEKLMRRAETAAQLELQPVLSQFQRGWEMAIGTSGTIRAVRSVLRSEGWSDGTITRTTLARLREALIDIGEVDLIEFAGLSPERAPVIPGGVAILTAVFEAFRIERMQAADGALREGLLYDLVGRLTHHDVRERTVNALVARFRADAAQAERVVRTAMALYRPVARAWSLDSEAGKLLGWAARLHEIGLPVAHSQYQKHGAYIIGSADLEGFSWQEQQLLATLIRGHRRKFPKDAFESLPATQQVQARRLCVLLRLAVLLHRARQDLEPLRMRLRAEERALTVRFSRAWLKHHPLTLADLEQEQVWLKAIGFRLRLA